MVRHKDSYIGRLHSDTGMVRVVSGEFRSTGGYRNPPGKLLGLMGLVVEERRPAREWRVPPLAQTELD